MYQMISVVKKDGFSLRGSQPPTVAGNSESQSFCTILILTTLRRRGGSRPCRRRRRQRELLPRLRHAQAVQWLRSWFKTS